MRRSTTLAVLAALALSGLLVAPGSSASEISSRAAGAGSLSVSPTTFVSGQSLTWTGKLPHRGIRTITMQRFLNRPGDSWIDVQGFSAKTRADGSFSFHYPAPDMMNIGFRVKGGKYVTEKLDLYAKQQDVVLAPVGPVIAGVPFTIMASTVLTGAPVFQGRTLTLQRRVDPTTWTTVATTTVGATGQGTFPNLSEPNPGSAVYRVIEENWTQGDNRVGWFPSFPTYLDVLSPTLPRSRVRTAPTDRLLRPTEALAPTNKKVTSRSTAALRWNWGYPIFDFDWTSGESLTSKPGRGSRQRGRWTEYLAGTGRVAKRSGQLGVWSGRTDKYGSGNRGDTATTLHGNPQAYGRWETKLRTVTKTGGPRYLVRAELVPERAGDYDCGAHNITLAEIRQGQTDATIGAVKGSSQWTRTITMSNLDKSSPAVAVELMKDHVTWFLNSNPVGTLKTRKVTGGVPMTLRLSLIGNGDQEMANTVLLSDWQRGFPINRSKGVLSGPSLQRSAFTPSCA